MSNLTDQFYASAERIWLCIRLAQWACDRFTEAHFDLSGYVNKPNCHICDTEYPHAYILAKKIIFSDEAILINCRIWAIH